MGGEGKQALGAASASKGSTSMKYDVIVVGAGSAGCVLAARLSEDSKRSVLLLEVGPDYPEFEQLPNDLKGGNIADAASRIDAPHNWTFWGTATPQQSEAMHVPRGRVVGGSSAINGQVLLRGIPEDYDNWASWGNTEWAFLKVLPYFRKLETDMDIQDDFHGSSGPIPVFRHKWEDWPRFQQSFYKACAAAGFREDPDMNNPDSAGVAPFPMNNPGGIRMSTALTYLDSARHRLNLTVRPGCLARCILFKGKRATGVEVECGGERHIVEGEEIVLCSGAVGSPQLLMLSGVGPADHLRSLGIQVAHDLPGVGQNLRDHPVATVWLSAKEGFPYNPDEERMQVVLRYTADGSSHRNDMHILASSAVSNAEGSLQIGAIRLAGVLYMALGAGELTLTSTDPKVQPHLDFRYLVDPRDRQRLREAIRLCVRLTAHEAYRDIVAERITPTDQDLSSDDALDAWLLRNVHTAQHICATCKMGPDSDPMAVVDQYCRVHGLEGLRVVDASVMPNVIRANTNATTIMIAERVADWMK